MKLNFDTYRSKVGWFAALVVIVFGMGMLSVQGDTKADGADASTNKYGRVVAAYMDSAMVAFKPQPEKIRQMLKLGLQTYFNVKSSREAWLKILNTNETIGLKVVSNPGPLGGTRPAVVEEIVKDMIEAGIPSRNILVWDRKISDLRLAGFFELAERYGVKVAASSEEGYDETQFYETALLGKLVYGDLEFGKKGEGTGRKSFVSKLVTKKMERIINITPLLNHSLAGVSGNLWSLTMGSVDNHLRFELDPPRLGEAIPELYALESLGDKVVLNIVDALICQYQGEDQGLMHYSTVLNQLRFSTDPVALDVLSIHELEYQRESAKAPRLRPNMEIYQNASLLDLGISDLRQIRVEVVP